MSSSYDECVLDTCWGCSLLYTYICQYCCCCFKRKINSSESTYICQDNVDVIEDHQSKSETNEENINFKYNFIVVELNINNKSYVIKKYENKMRENCRLFDIQFVTDYLKDKKKLNNDEKCPEYKINIMDNNSNFVTLDNNSYLLLKIDKYEKICVDKN